MDFQFDKLNANHDSVGIESKEQEEKYDENGNLIPPIDEEEEKRKAEEEAARIKEEEEKKKAEEEAEKNKKEEITYEEGQVIEVTNEKGETVTYTVDKDGNLLDKDGNIFKESKDVKEFIDSFETKEENNKDELNIDNIQSAVGIEVTDDKGNKVEYQNNPEGIKTYINDVIENQKEEISTAAVNGVFDKYPILKDVLTYYIANGNSLDGFGEVKDRSEITIDENNEVQQENIIRAAYKEKQIKGDVDSYINYLKSSGTLLQVAKAELEGLKEKDNAAKEALAKQAKEQEENRIKQETEYWTSVHDLIKTRKIAGYTIPESIIVEKDGHKVAKTPEDFFAYLYQVDKNGNSRYVNDLLQLPFESRRDDEVLRAYLMFTGGNYSDLVKMAINEEKVKTIKLQAKNNNKTTIRVKPKVNNNPNNVELGY